MNLTAPERARLSAIVTMSHLVKQMEVGATRMDAGRYRELAQEITKTLIRGLPAELLGVIFETYPATAQLHENLQYEHRGLGRAPREAADTSDLLMRKELARIAAGHLRA